MPFSFPYGGYPDIGDRAAAAGEAIQSAPPAPPPAPRPDIVATETEIVDTGNYDNLPQDPGVGVDMLDQADKADDVSGGVYGLIPGAGVQPMAIQPKQLDYDKAGGAGPIAEIQDQSQNMASSMERQGQDAEIENRRLADVYSGEAQRQTNAAAEWRKREIENQEFYAKRAQQIDSLGDQIARKKIDEGRWVKNPGNFLAAIGAALVGMGSGDATVGYRLVDQAIQRDLAAQRWEHDQMRVDKLGLESNVQLYRQLTGDRQSGDMVHEAKLRQATAMKVEEISAQLRSKEARERGIMMAAELRKQAAQLLQISNAAAFLPPQQRAKALADAQTNFGDVTKLGANGNSGRANQATGQAIGNAAAAQGSAGGNQGGGHGQPMAVPGQPQVPSAQGPAPKEDGVITAGTTYDETAPEGRKSIDYSRHVANLPTWDRKRMQRAAESADQAIGVPGAGALVVKARMKELATVAAIHPGNVKAQNAELVKREEQAQARLTEKAKNVKDVETKASKWADLLRANAELRKKFTNDRGETDYAAIDSWMGQGWKLAAGSKAVDFGRSVQELWTKPGSHRTLSDSQRAAAQVYAAKLQAVINSYGHEEFGGSVTATGSGGGELGRLKAVMDASDPSRKLFAIADTYSKEYGTQLMKGISPGSKAADVIMYLAQRGIRSSGLPTEGR